MNKIKGYRTYLVAAAVTATALSAAFMDPAVIAAIPPRWMGIIVAILGGVMAFLRSISTTPPGQSGQ